AAINGVIPQENGILQSEYGVETLHGPAYGPPSHSAAASSAPSSSSAFRHVVPSRQIVERQPRMLDFRVEYRDRNVDVVLEDSSTVGDIKHILENELQIPASKMLLKGWKTGDVDDSTVLKSLHLPKNNSLYVLTPDLPPPSSSHSGALQESLNQNFMLIVTHREVQREYNLNFSGSSTIQEAPQALCWLLLECCNSYWPGSQMVLCVMDIAAVLWNGQQGVILERTSAELSPKGSNISDVTLDSLNSE
ncbi:hypothetical protein Nmel_011297, partial [Mimus melanotis]